MDRSRKASQSRTGGDGSVNDRGRENRRSRKAEGTAKKVVGKTNVCVDAVGMERDRGDLAKGPLPLPVLGADPVLDVGVSIDDALQLILRSCLEHALANERAVMCSDDIEGVHQMRVAVRRLRSCLSIFRDVLPAGADQRSTRLLKPLLGILGPVRDWDVFVDEEIASVRAFAPESVAIGQLEEVAMRQKALLRRNLRSFLGSRDYRRIVNELGLWVEKREWRLGLSVPDHDRLAEPCGSFVVSVLERLHRRTIKRGRHIRELPVPDLHRLRIAVKKERYAVEFFAGCYDTKRVTPFRSVLKKLQNELGKLNDCSTAMDLITGLPNNPQIRSAGMFLQGWHARDALELRERLPKLWKCHRDAKAFWKRRVRRKSKS